MKLATSPDIKKYFNAIDKGVKKAYSVAEKAKLKGLDPDDIVPIPLAANMAERVVGLISIVAPQITGTNVVSRIIELEKEYGMLDWRVGFKIAVEVAKENFCKFKDKLEAMEVGIRMGFAYLTLGIVSAPLEGFIGLKIKKRGDGKEYVAVCYAGPIRGAGGTAASTSVILADYVRVQMGYANYDPQEIEVNRITAEVNDYHERVTNLQYRPSDPELKFMISHLPVEVDGDPTEKIEVSNYKDLPRIETNLIRGGIALVLAEGLCQKAPKLWKKLSKWGKDFQIDWTWLADFIKLKEETHAAGKADPKKEGKKIVKPNNTFMMDMVAGRPILTYPVTPGGFRLRYGRGRTCGMYATGVNPATLIVLDKYIAIGTQLKVERPRKGATTTICDTVDGPIVKLKDGTVLQLSTADEARQVLSQVDEVIFLGDLLFSYGDFAESGHSLVPVGYCPEWWVLEVEKSIQNMFKDNSAAAIALKVDVNRLTELLKNPLTIFPTWEENLSFCDILKISLHPEFLFFWKLIKGDEVIKLQTWLSEAKIKRNSETKKIEKIIIPFLKNPVHLEGKRILEELGVPHQVIGKENIVLAKKQATIFVSCLQLEKETTSSLKQEDVEEKDGLEVINYLADFTIKDKAGTFIGARMGRPEKAKMRTLTGSPQVMFPVGEEGDRLRSFQSALKAGKIRSSFPLYHCKACDKSMVYKRCEECNELCEQKFYCRFCGDLDKDTCRHGAALTFKTKDVDIKYLLNLAQKRAGEKVIPDLIKGVRGTSNRAHVVEHLTKGILRAKNEIYVNKDGTTRFDATQLPITHFKPKEIGTSIEKLQSIGYLNDIHGVPLTDANQILELKPQDVILPGFDSLEASGPTVLLRVSKFVDDILKKMYGLKSYYNASKAEDLVGHLIIGLAPHISAGMVGRIIGFSETQGFFAHPMYHAALRRDCDGDEAAAMLLMDALLNFSRQYLPSSRGSTMDSPLVLTSVLNPAEVDDQVLEMDVCWRYPLELYEAADEMKYPWEVKFGDDKKIEQLNDRLGTDLQYEKFGYTHDTDDLNKGVCCSAYKILPSMKDKLIGQMEIARKLRAVDMDDVAKLVIQKHFLRDIKGNLRKFSMQKFRCVKCNAKYRRPPLKRSCTTCGGRLIFTISEGSVVKYLFPSLELCDRYDFSPYLKQTLDLIKNNVDTVFGKEKDKQVGLAGFISN